MRLCFGQPLDIFWRLQNISVFFTHENGVFGILFLLPLFGFERVPGEKEEILTYMGIFVPDIDYFSEF